VGQRRAELIIPIGRGEVESRRVLALFEAQMTCDLLTDWRVSTMLVMVMTIILPT